MHRTLSIVHSVIRRLAGYVHAFAHSIGAKYHISHGNAIALSLLPVIYCQKNRCIDRLAELSRYRGLSDRSDSDETACNRLLEEIRKLIDLCAFEKKLLIPKEDYPSLARAVSMDSINYSAPVVLNNRQIYAVLDEING